MHLINDQFENYIQQTKKFVRITVIFTTMHLLFFINCFALAGRMNNVRGAGGFCFKICYLQKIYCMYLFFIKTERYVVCIVTVLQLKTSNCCFWRGSCGHAIPFVSITNCLPEHQYQCSGFLMIFFLKFSFDFHYFIS